MSGTRDLGVSIVGVGETSFTRGDPRSATQLAVDAVRAALADAGLDGRDVDGFLLEGTGGPHDTPVDLVAAAIGAEERGFGLRLQKAGAGLVGAPAVAAAAIAAGLASTIVVYFGLSMSRASAGATGIHAADPVKAALEMPFGWHGQAVYFAGTARRYDHEFGGLTETLGGLAVSARAHAALTPGAIRTKPLSVDDYLAEAPVAEPLRRSDCCLINDGGVAYVLTSQERARDLRRPPVEVAGCAVASKHTTFSDYFTQAPDLLTTAAADSSRRAYAQAGIGPADVDLVEIYDCFTISLLLQLEDMGFAPKGGGGELVASGAVAPGGRRPVNTHGGLLAHSYMVGGSHVVEAVRQLRGERADAQVAGARVAAVAGLGIPDHATLVLTRP
ncbi:Thiolase [Frankia canadensis]|uniref:Thiolase n=1 Tax=Frankia canadensis TaxID=1836972 RepID=A0A2I2KLB7_9ACTN|nr:thiolase family protein [Frankia canadensis]SNQ46468.1 Thiolase [Frankia canadensis]SOU53758.1 Thiolase [Frankia canadensis]